MVLAEAFVFAFDGGSEIFIFVVENHFDQLEEAPGIRDLLAFLDGGGGDGIEEGKDDGFGLFVGGVANFAPLKLLVLEFSCHNVIQIKKAEKHSEKWNKFKRRNKFDLFCVKYEVEIVMNNLIKI